MPDPDEKNVFARHDKSGWTVLVHPLSDYNFDRVYDDEIFGVPLYVNNGRVWPLPSKGVTVIWPHSQEQK